MADISRALLTNLYLSGDYAPMLFERPAAPYSPSAVKVLRDYVAQQKWVSAPFDKALGNGAQPSFVRHASSLMSGSTSGPLFLSAKVFSVGHPCKRQQSVMPVLRAGVAGMVAGVPPALLGATLGGICAGAASGFVGLFTHGIVGGISLGIATGISITFSLTLLLSAGVGLLAAYAAVQIAVSRTDDDIATSHYWEDISGGIAAIPRAVVALWAQPERLVYCAHALQSF